jgi:hypothetical protein
MKDNSALKFFLLSFLIICGTGGLLILNGSAHEG